MPGVLMWLIIAIDFMAFSERGEWDLSAVFTVSIILILAKLIAGKWSVFKCNAIMKLWARFSIAIAQKLPFGKLRNLTFIALLRNPPESFRICSRHENEMLQFYLRGLTFWQSDIFITKINFD